MIIRLKLVLSDQLVCKLLLKFRYIQIRGIVRSFRFETWKVGGDLLLRARFCESLLLSPFLAWPSQDVFLLALIPWIEQGRILFVTLIYALCDGLTIYKLNWRSEYRSPTLCLLMNHDCNTTWDNEMVTLHCFHCLKTYILGWPP